jgi:hypothetical protein
VTRQGGGKTYEEKIKFKRKKEEIRNENNKKNEER